MASGQLGDPLDPSAQALLQSNADHLPGKRHYVFKGDGVVELGLAIRSLRKANPAQMVLDRAHAGDGVLNQRIGLEVQYGFLQ